MDKPSPEEFKGRAKAAGGELTGNKDLKREGKVDQAAAKVRDKADDAIDAVKDKLTDDDH